MKILHHQPYALPAMLRADFTPMGEGRSPKRHLSEITRAMQQAAGGATGPIQGEQEGLRPQAGFMFERTLENTWKEYHRETRPVELQFTVEYDGIVGTPDGLETLDNILMSMKFTWKSMRKWEEDPQGYFVDWFAREQGYLWMLRKGDFRLNDGIECFARIHRINKLRFLIFWVNGDYTRQIGRGPQITDTLFEFSDEELERNWNTIVRYRDWLDKQDKEAAIEEGR